ncbi:MAG: FapA family protein [Giesbergeria sp.]|uniref:FapA family protein n=1 Tax=Giesbergeria sp. TaxID=2818473 RepID=UPI00261235F9|nr:FapA family protein [Giesbergeria sp.]MDD2609610.1 FapA family protein [Giesbergeria sp.]
MSVVQIQGLSFEEADNQILLVALPTPGREPIDGDTLQHLLEQEGYGDCSINQNALHSAAEMCNVQKEPFGIEVARRLDAEYQVFVSSDGMNATLNIIAPIGGKAANPEDALRALSKAGVTFGIDQTAIQDACQRGSCSNVIIARGRDVLHGADALFEDLIPHTVNREPKLDENGLIDYRERGEIVAVQPGAPLMRRTPATAGTDGQTVKGVVVKAKPGKDKPFATGLKGAEVSAEDACVLVAAVGGLPVRVDAGVNVEPVLRYKEINMATGNIHFDGSVHVTGEVVQGMTVHASGDIIVDGMVDSGNLHAGGDIRIAGGIIGRSKIEAQGSVMARFAEGVEIRAGTVIALKDMALECELHAINQITIGTGSRKTGRLVGGHATAMMAIRVVTLGSDKGGTTKITLGVNPALDAEYAALLKRIEEEKEQETRLEQLVKQLKTADPKGLLERARSSWQQAVQAWGKSLKERETLEKELEKARLARLEVAVGTQGTVEISLCKLVARLRQDFGSGAFYLDEGGNLIFTGRDGKPVILALG